MLGKVLITGGLGNLGSYITKEFCKSGYDVYVLTRKEKNKIYGIKYKVIEADITNINILKKKLNIDFDYCIHLASYNEFFTDDYPKKALEINTLGTRNLLEVLSDKLLQKFIYFSTFHVYGAKDGTVNEQSLLCPKNDYASTHLFAEYYIKQFASSRGLNYSILRLTNSYGVPIFSDTNKWYLMLNDFVKSAYTDNNIVIKSNGQIKKDFIWMPDVSKIVVKLLNTRQSGTYNLSANKSFKLLEIANLINIEYKKRYNKNIKITINEEDKTIYKDLSVDNSKLKNLIEFKLNDKLVEEVNNIFDLLERR